jgi:hypothetical protein
MKWLTSNPLILGIIGLVLVAAVVAYFTFADKKAQRQEGNLVDKGVLQERSETQGEVINRTKEATDVREEISRNDDAGLRLRYEQCMRSARTPANCQRLLPQRPAPVNGN